jgi:hypothetical protein
MCTRQLLPELLANRASLSLANRQPIPGQRERLLDEAFGAARSDKTAEHLREGRLPTQGLALAAKDAGDALTRDAVGIAGQGREGVGGRRRGKGRGPEEAGVYLMGGRRQFHRAPRQVEAESADDFRHPWTPPVQKPDTGLSCATDRPVPKS